MHRPEVSFRFVVFGVYQALIFKVTMLSLRRALVIRGVVLLTTLVIKASPVAEVSPLLLITVRHPEMVLGTGVGSAAASRVILSPTSLILGVEMVKPFVVHLDAKINYYSQTLELAESIINYKISEIDKYKLCFY